VLDRHLREIDAFLFQEIELVETHLTVHGVRHQSDAGDPMGPSGRPLNAPLGR